MFATQPGDPHLHPFERPLQGFNFPNMATKLSVFDALIKEVDSFGMHHLLHADCVGKEKLKADPIFLLSDVHHLEGLLKEPAGVEGEEFYLRGEGIDYGGDRLIFGSEA